MLPASWWGAELLAHGDDDAGWARARNTVTRGELRLRVDELARLLGSHGIQAGDTVAVQARPSFTLLWTLLALWSRDVQVVLVDPWLTSAEVNELLTLCAPRHHIRIGGLDLTMTPFREECEIIVRAVGAGRRAGTDHCLVQFSSGVTGAPKVIGRTAESLLAELDRFRAIDGMPVAGDRVLLLHPMTHSLGLIGGVLHGLNVGATIIFTDLTRRQEIAYGSAADEVTAIFGLPKHFAELCALPHPLRLPALRIAVSGGEALSRSVLERFECAYGIRIGQAYGMSEVGIIATDLTGRHPPPAVGTPAPGVVVRIVDGSLQVGLPRTPYLHGDSPDRYADGWLKTYDLITQDPAGVMWLHGRVNSTRSVRGVDVNLLEIEAVLRDHEYVTEAVVLYGEVLQAHITTIGFVQPTELAAWCLHRLGQARVPERFHVVSAIPRTSNGKLIRNPDRLEAAYLASARGRRWGKRLAKTAELVCTPLRDTELPDQPPVGIASRLVRRRTTRLVPVGEATRTRPDFCDHFNAQERE